MKDRYFVFVCLFVSASLCLIIPTLTQAHRDDYIDETLVYLTVPGHVFEPEYWFDYGDNRPGDFHFLRHNFSAEYGVTDYWQVEFVASLLDTLPRGTGFQSGLFETRGRFFEEGTLPVDIAVSGELNMEHTAAGGWAYGLEPRLVLSKDPNSNTNVTLNLPLQIPVHEGEFSFEPSLGARLNAGSLLRLAMEVKYESELREAAFVPQIWFALPYDILLKTGAILGTGSNRENFFRVALEMDLFGSGPDD